MDDCGRLGEANEVMGMAVFRGKLYASPLYQEGKGLYRGGQRLDLLRQPRTPRSAAGGLQRQPLRRQLRLWTFRAYDGPTQWTDLGKVPETTQVYSFAVYEGRLHTLQLAHRLRVRLRRREERVDTRGTIGERRKSWEWRSIMGSSTPARSPWAPFTATTAGRWTLTGQLDDSQRDLSPRVVHGRVPRTVVCRHAPIRARVFFEAGKSATCDRELAPGWRHVAALKAGGVLKLYVDGQCVATSTSFKPADYDLSNAVPLRIGFGQHDYFCGRMRDVRLYNRAISEEEIRALAKE